MDSSMNRTRVSVWVTRAAIGLGLEGVDIMLTRSAIGPDDDEAEPGDEP